MQAPRPAALHWSRVEPGQAFTLTLEYDSEIYEGALEREVTWDITHGLLALGALPPSIQLEWISYKSTAYSYTQRLHGGYTAVTGGEKISPGWGRQTTYLPHRCGPALSR